MAECIALRRLHGHARVWGTTCTINILMHAKLLTVSLQNVIRQVLHQEKERAHVAVRLQEICQGRTFSAAAKKTAHSGVESAHVLHRSVRILHGALCAAKRAPAALYSALPLLHLPPACPQSSSYG